MSSDLEGYTDVIWITGIWLFMGYFFMELGSNSKPLFGESTKAHQYWGERIFGNLLEQSIFFIVSLWIHAIFSSKDDAATLGYTWLAFRALYPWVWMWNGRFKVPDQLLITLPQYSIILYMMGSTMLQLKYNINVKDLSFGNKWYGVVLFGIFFNLVFGFCMLFTKFVIKPNFFKERVTNNPKPS
jgi:hypothetical protein